MRALLDTNALLWWLKEPDRLSREQYDAIADDRHDIAVSAISVAEIAIKTSIGKLTGADGITEWIARQGFRELPLANRHALVLADLPLHHRDPFDRMLVAQCIADDLVLLTGDRRLTAYPITTIT
ncbi:type II toxin-antitoxin system VapC family toxin [Microcella sp.]|uniref:type II toxin-antitoxin system VapC family toxin n=1 Tax=Microcella sp. TaxID=1913979 RepID=UPI003F6FE827